MGRFRLEVRASILVPAGGLWVDERIPVDPPAWDLKAADQDFPY
jgi:hypothetical protein